MSVPRVWVLVYTLLGATALLSPMDVRAQANENGGYKPPSEVVEPGEPVNGVIGWLLCDSGLKALCASAKTGSEGNEDTKRAPELEVLPVNSTLERCRQSE